MTLNEIISYFFPHVIPSPLQEKCHQYWPAERSARYQYFVVDPMSEYNMPQYILREFKVTDARVSETAVIGPCEKRNPVIWAGLPSGVGRFFFFFSTFSFLWQK